MKIRKNGIYKTIDSKDFGIYQKAGFEKVITDPFKKLEAEDNVKAEAETETEELEEIIDELPKSKKKGK